MSDEKKIIIDEDWKSQVEAEREALGGEVKPQAAAAKAATEEMVYPPASFEMLLTTLATEALVALGQVPHPATGKPEVARNHAKYIIDTIDVLHEKTNGNLTPAEQQMIDALLHQLRIVFVETAPAATQ